MGAKPGNGRAILVLALAAFALVATGAAAQAEPPTGPPGTMVLDITIDAGVTELRPGPLTVPNPQGPNPFYEALQRGEPVLSLAPVQLEDAPDGLYVEAADGRPVKVLGWTPGIGQQSWKPLEYVGQVVGANTGLPIQLNGCACAVRPTYGPQGILTLPLGYLPGGAGPLGVKPTAPQPVLEQEFVEVDAEGENVVAQPYAPAFQPSASPPLSEAAAGSLPVPNDSATALAAVLAAGAAVVAFKVVAPLYHRFRRKTALDNPTRQRLYELLRAAPGASAAELSQGSGLHVTTVKYHLDVLRRVGMVGEQVVDGCRRFFSYENGDRLEFLTRALLDEPAAKAIYAQIAQHPGLPFIEVARALGMRKEHVHYHVKKLAKHGLLVDRWEAGRRLLFIAPAGGHGTLVSPAPSAVPSVPVAAVVPRQVPPGAPATPLHPEVRA